MLPEGLEVPHPSLADGTLQSDGPLVTSGPVLHQDTNTIVIRDFSYSGDLDDAIFVVGSGDVAAAGVQLPDEKGGEAPLRKYKRETLSLRLPKEARGKPVQYVGVWSPSQGMITSVTFPPNDRIPPPVESLV
ncbi:protein Skeletor, isoforms B/C [Hyalella azteca]|uniref:Protein Skeletor, isoforms B/C n=1 Tax=Hyalella azteca TaxID=294128 RepID=A0A8B7P746_HYAAZ|nr:protein Skeletor, isoforms B/C [Hyalella azteca]